MSHDIWDYVAATDAVQADRVTYRILEPCLLLATQPYMGRERTELAPALRSFPIGSYVIFYRPIPDGVEIARILNASRDIEALLWEP